MFKLTPTANEVPSDFLMDPLVGNVLGLIDNDTRNDSPDVNFDLVSGKEGFSVYSAQLSITLFHINTKRARVTMLN